MRSRRTEGTRRVAQPARERHALHELHREVGDAAVVDRELVDGHDVRVLELAGDLRLGDEAVAVERLLRELLVEALQRDVPEQVAVGGRVDAPHAAARELLEDAQVGGRRDALAQDLLPGDLVVSADRDRFDDVDGRRLRIVGHSKRPRYRSLRGRVDRWPTVAKSPPRARARWPRPAARR